MDCNKSQMGDASRQRGQAQVKNYSLVENKTKRVNLKCKRKRNLIKKAIELQKLTDLDICIVIKDDEMNKVIQFASNRPNSPEQQFSVDIANKLVQSMV